MNNKNTDTNTSTTKEYTLESIVGADNMDAVIKSAITVWDNFLEKYPDSFINKTFLQRNIGLIHKLIETIVPNIMRQSVELEEQLEELSASYEALQAKRLHDLLLMSSVLKTTISCIKTIEELSVVNFRTEAYGHFFALDADQKELSNPIWILCVVFPNETLSPFFVTHSEYLTYIVNNKHIQHIELDECALLKESEEVANLLQELDME